MTDAPIPTPKERTDFIGHSQAERALAEAVATDRVHHAWLLTGLKGVGKATLAYRFARKLLTQTPEPVTAGLFGDGPTEGSGTLDIDSGDPVVSRIAGGGHGDLMVVERSADPKSGRMRDEIPVDDIRRLIRFFSMTGAETGRRIAIIDAADEMNRNAANALLKVLEEPPEGAVLILVAHRPGRLLPTIRSRCRHLPLGPLSEAEIGTLLEQNAPDLPQAQRATIAAMADGSAGRALDLASEEGTAVLDRFDALTADLARAPAADIHAFADYVAGRESDTRYRIFADLLRSWVAARTRGQAMGQGQSPGAVQTPLDRWFQVWEKITHLTERADAVHLDRKQVVITLLLDLQTLAR